MRDSKTYLASESSESRIGVILRRVEKYNLKIEWIYKKIKKKKEREVLLLHFSEVDTVTCRKIEKNKNKNKNTNSMYVLVYLRYNENKRTSNSRKAVMQTGQRCKGNLEKSKLTSNLR